MTESCSHMGNMLIFPYTEISPVDNRDRGTRTTFFSYEHNVTSRGFNGIIHDVQQSKFYTQFFFYFFVFPTKTFKSF